MLINNQNELFVHKMTLNQDIYLENISDFSTTTNLLSCGHLAFPYQGLTSVPAPNCIENFTSYYDEWLEQTHSNIESCIQNELDFAFPFNIKVIKEDNTTGVIGNMQRSHNYYWLDDSTQQ